MPASSWRDEAEALRLGLVFLDEAFARAQAGLGEAAPCRRGCSACCETASVFEIHVADAALLAAGLETLEAGERARVVERAAAVSESVRAAAAVLAGEGEPAFGGWSPEDGLAAVPPRALDLLAARAAGPCPLLDGDGSCVLHAWRPAICRLQGIPWRDPQTGAELPDFCRLDPRQASNPAQPADLALLDELRETARTRLEATGECGKGIPAGRTFVAEALLRHSG